MAFQFVDIRLSFVFLSSYKLYRGAEMNGFARENNIRELENISLHTLY